MSVPNLISPLLDGFVMGDAISSHDGVRCCPAMRVSDDSRYFVKIISVPASQTKLDALLLAGAFSDRESAAGYFQELAQDVVEEAVLLQRFARLEGFSEYESWQIVPMEDEVGFDVYLLAPYRPTLERRWRKSGLTHLQALNLGLDLCSALASCRRSGYLYLDLKPENVCICANQEYRIGDIGFMSLSSLAYASLPERCRSAYTPPEITDAYSSLNETMDTYAVGLILYQAFNDGALPEGLGSDQLAAPRYADGDMAQIILKACHADPAERWQDPVQMGQALVSYMQSHSVNDVPIVPVPAEEPEFPAEEPQPESEPELRTEDVLAEADLALEAAAEFPVGTDEAAPETVEEPVTEVEEEPAAEIEEAPVTPDASTEEAAVSEEPETTEDADVVEETEAAEEAEAVPAPDAAEVPSDSEEEPSDWSAEETAAMLEQADALIAHELPEPPVAPEPIDIPIPAPIVLESEAAEEPPEEAAEVPVEQPEESEEIAEEPEAEVPTEPEEAEEEPEEVEEEAPPRKKRGGLIALLVVLLLLAAGTFAGWFYYNNYYLQTIDDLQLSGEENWLTVSLQTDTDNALLTVYCTDTYGNTQHLPVVNNTATFTDLKPDTRYTVSVQIEGFHKLIGATADTYTTDEQTVISDFAAVVGDSDGAVILSFTVQGPETANWKVLYSCPGEEEKELVFNGHMVVVTGLTPDQTYTFRLESTSDLYVVGQDTLEFTARNLVFAEELKVESFYNNTLTAVWQAPEGVTVGSWTVICAGDNGYSKTVTVADPTAVFAELDPSASYTVQVIAEGMTVGTSTFLAANSVTVETVTVDDSVPGQITLNWTFQGKAPDTGWLVLYTASGIAEQQVIRTDVPSVTIAPVIPGTAFDFVLQNADGCTVFGGTAQHQTAAAEPFAGFMLTSADLTFRMCRTPAVEAWGQADVPAADYINTFAPGEKASFAIFIGTVYGISDEIVRTLAVIRDEAGNVVDTLTVERGWSDMWFRNFGKLDLFELPGTTGNYTVEVYFNEMLVTSQSFTIA